VECSEATFATIEALIEDVRRGVSKTDKDRKSKLATLTTGSFLSNLRDAVLADILALNIDYFALHIRCVDLLRDIYVKLNANFVKYLGSGYVEKEGELEQIQNRTEWIQRLWRSLTTRSAGLILKTRCKSSFVSRYYRRRGPIQGHKNYTPFPSMICPRLGRSLPMVNLHFVSFFGILRPCVSPFN
jgi:hypothetical protein